MKIRRLEEVCTGIKLSIPNKEGAEIAHAYGFILCNSLHDRPWMFIEDVMVDESMRGQGIGKQLIEELKKIAAEKNCYKIIACSRYSRPKVHDFYASLSFSRQGHEFRMDL